jgi:putative flippase GtrA
MSATSHNSARTKIFFRWLRFNLIGGIGIAVQLALLFLLKSVLDLNYLAATGLAVEVTVVHNFLWHERYTWVDRVRPSWRESLPRLLRFNLTNGGVSFVGNLVLMRIMVGAGHMNYLAANAVAIAACSLVNFVVSDAYVFETCASATSGSMRSVVMGCRLHPVGGERSGENGAD